MAIKSRKTELAYFGKPGSFTHLVAQQIKGSYTLVSRETVHEVFNFVKEAENRRGLVPIENTSGGMILDTIDQLVETSSNVIILDEFSLNVKLALLGKTGGKVKKIYSHFVPFHHCEKWLKANYPEAEKVIVDSTSAAAQNASLDPHSAAIGHRSAGTTYGLEVLHYPIGDNQRNITQFYLLGPAGTKPTKSEETGFSVILKNEVGSLYRFLGPFAENQINLKRIMSRPIIGQDNGCVFFVCAQASEKSRALKAAMAAAQTSCLELRALGSYPVHPPFES